MTNNGGCDSLIMENTWEKKRKYVLVGGFCSSFHSSLQAIWSEKTTATYVLFEKELRRWRDVSSQHGSSYTPIATMLPGGCHSHFIPRSNSSLLEGSDRAPAFRYLFLCITVLLHVMIESNLSSPLFSV